MSAPSASQAAADDEPFRLRHLPDGTTIVAAVVTLPPGWNQQSATVQFVLPVAFPSAQPDCFYVEPSLRLANGSMPANSGIQPLDGQQLLWFSWHLAAWSPAHDTIDSYLRFVERRLRDVH
jgi:hypothetical protein